MSPVRSVTVYCSSSKRVPAVYTQAAQELGAAIAAAGWTLVYGGNDTGCMGTLARAARAGGGRVVGVSPQIFVDKGVIDNLCDELIITEDMRKRKEIMEQSGDAFVALPGGIGTYEELFEILVGKQLKFHNKPIVVVNIDDYFRPLIDMLQRGLQLGFVRTGTLEQMHITPSIPAGIEHIRSYQPGGAVDIVLERPDGNGGGLEG
ncbi:MAG: TIGR00730 family Rossman fold protein [Tepidisphaeraceae bacterium]